MPAPKTICPHGREIREIWWECDDCAVENGIRKEDLRGMWESHERSKRRSNDWSHSDQDTKPVSNLEDAIRNIGASIVTGIFAYFIFGFGGCVVRMVGIGNRWIESDSGGEAFYSYVQEAVIIFFFVIAIGFFSALKIIFEPKLSKNTNKSISFGIKAGLIAFPLAAIIVFGFAGFSSETETDSKTGRFYTVVNSSGVNLKGNHYSKNDTIEILEETENAICLKLPSGKECFPTPFVLQKTGKKNIRTLLDDGNVSTKTVQNKHVVTSAMSAFLGNLFLSLLVAFIVAVSTIVISKHIFSLESNGF